MEPVHLSLRARLRAGEQLLGVLVRMPSEDLVEMAALAGFDFVIVDCEHGPADVLALRQHLAVAQLHGCASLVRVGTDEPALVLRALDQGAGGIIAPHIDTAAQARALVAAAHYPPLGERGFATYGRAGGFGRVPAAEHRRRQADHTLVVGMVESPLGVANVAEIVAVEGIDAIMVGTADLAASSGPGDPQPAEGITEVHRALAGSATARMDIVSGSEAAAASYATGANLVVYNLTHIVNEVLDGLLLQRPGTAPPRD